MTAHLPLTAPSSDAAAPSLRWSAIAGGVVVALAAMVLLFSLGLACGLTTLQMDDAGSLSRTQLLSGIWGSATPFAALLAGGYIAGRAANVGERSSGALHGLVMWGLAAIGLVWASVGLISTLAGGVVSVSAQAARAGGRAVVASLQGGASGAEAIKEVAEQLGAKAPAVDMESVLGTINARLHSAGRGPVSLEQAQAAGRSLIDQARRDGRLDREAFVAAVGEHTGLKAEDARAVADAVEQQLKELGGRAQSLASDAMARVRQEADRAQAALRATFWGLFAALSVGLVAAVGGGAWGAGPRRR